MMNTKNILNAFFLLFTCGMFSACGSGATAKLQFSSNQSSAGNGKLNTALTSENDKVAASLFKMKFIAAYLAEDIDPVTQSNTGKSQMFWVNPVCGDDLMHCDVSGGTAEDGAPISKIVNDFFDFSSPGSVNQSLNSQAREIEEGSYRYVRLEFCKYNQSHSENVQWASEDAGITEPVLAERNNCVVNSVVFNPPLKVEAGVEVTVSLAYHLDGLVGTDNGNAGGGDLCSNGKCLTLPEFVPTASIQK